MSRDRVSADAHRAEGDKRGGSLRAVAVERSLEKREWRRDESLEAEPQCEQHSEADEQADDCGAVPGVLVALRRSAP